MLSRRSRVLTLGLKVSDMLGMALCFLLAARCLSSAENITLGHFLSMRISVQNLFISAAFIAVWQYVLSGHGLYELKRLSERGIGVIAVAKAASFCTVALFIFAAVFRIKMVSAGYLAFFWAGTSTQMLISRLMLRSALKRLRRRGRNLRNVVVIGTNLRAVRMAGRFETGIELGYRLLGFIDDDWPRLREFHKTGHALVGGLAGLRSFLRENVVDEVMVCLPMKSFYQEIKRIAAYCEEQGIVVNILSDLFNLRLARSCPALIEDQPIVTLYTGNIIESPVSAKRLMDIAVSALFIVLSSPLMLATAVLIKVSSPGPVFFVQERLGLNKRRIRVYKFRTMVPDAGRMQAGLEHLNEADGPAFKIKNDPRITPAGKFLRKSSIDELPQLFNVLKGDMSMVGPRPLPVRDYLGFSEDWHRRRFSVRPGITCLWQVGGRSGVSFDRWMELDMEYIDRWSLWLDLKILLETIPAVLKGSGAA